MVLGWERRLTRHTNLILQFYASPSVVSDATLDELTAEKYLVSIGLQSRRGAWFRSYAAGREVMRYPRSEGSP